MLLCVMEQIQSCVMVDGIWGGVIGPVLSLVVVVVLGEITIENDYVPLEGGVVGRLCIIVILMLPEMDTGAPGKDDSLVEGKNNNNNNEMFP